MGGCNETEEFNGRLTMRSIWNLPFIFGLIAAVFGVSFMLGQLVIKLKCIEHTEGVIEMVKETRMGIDVAYPGLTYTVNNVVHSKPFSGGSFPEGKTVTVFYDPSNPKRTYVLEDKSNLRIIGIAFTIGGIVFMLVGYGVYRELFSAIYNI